MPARFDRKAATSRVVIAAMAVLIAPLSGCGIATKTGVAPISIPIAKKVTFTGRARGGQQPIAGASVSLYLAAAYGPGTYGGINPVQVGEAPTDSSGNFEMTDFVTCTGSELVYMVVIEGDPGIGSVNYNIGEMAALGPCDNLNSTTYIEINELTTVASVYALAQFINGSPFVGSTTNNLGGLTQAFSDVNQLTNTNTGTIPGPALPAGAIFPTAKMNTLANIIAACINSAGGTAGDGSPCGTLFAAATPPGGTAPTDTVTALANIAQNPANNVSTLFGLPAPESVYAPSLTKPPNDWLLAVKYKPTGMSSPSAVVADGSGNIWVTNKGGNNVLELSHAGVLETTASSGFLAPTALAVDLSGNVWVAQSGNSSMKYVLANGSAGASVSTGSGGLNLPSSIAVDPAGNVWVANSGANTVTELNSSGATVSTAGYSGTGIVGPLGIAISPQ